MNNGYTPKDELFKTIVPPQSGTGEVEPSKIAQIKYFEFQTLDKYILKVSLIESMVKSRDDDLIVINSNTTGKIILRYSDPKLLNKDYLELKKILNN